MKGWVKYKERRSNSMRERETSKDKTNERRDMVEEKGKKQRK